MSFAAYAVSLYGQTIGWVYENVPWGHSRAKGCWWFLVGRVYDAECIRGSFSRRVDAVRGLVEFHEREVIHRRCMCLRGGQPDKWHSRDCPYFVQGN